MVEMFTKEAVVEGTKKLLKDGFETICAGTCAGFIVASAWTGVQLGYKGWSIVYAGIGKGVKIIAEKLKKKPEPQTPEEPKPEEPTQK